MYLGQGSHAELGHDGGFDVLQYHRYVAVTYQRQQKDVPFQVVDGIDFQLGDLQIETESVALEVQTGTLDGRIRWALDVELLEATAERQSPGTTRNLDGFDSQRVKRLNSDFGYA